MGSCLSLDVQEIKNKVEKNKFHFIFYQTSRSQNEFIDFQSEIKQELTQHYVITKPSYVIFDPFLQTSIQHWSENLTKNAKSFNKIILGLNPHQNRLKKQKKPPVIKNDTYESKSTNNELWEVIEQTISSESIFGMKLKENQVFKIGLQRVQVAAIQNKLNKSKNIKFHGDFWNFIPQKTEFCQKNEGISTENDALLKKNSKNSSISSKNQVKDYKGPQKCRICSEFEEPKNQLISVCECTEKRPVHQKCFQSNLLRNLKISKTPKMLIFDFNNIYCSMCKTLLSPNFTLNNENRLLVDLDIPFNDALIIFKLFNIQSPEKLKAIIVIDTSRDCKIIIGSDKSCDILFKHSTVSPEHAILFIDRQDIFITDNNSKQGTMKLVPRGKCLKKINNKTLCAGKWLIEIHAHTGDVCDCFQKDSKMPEMIFNPFEKNEMENITANLMNINLIDNKFSNIFKKNQVGNILSNIDPNSGELVFKKHDLQVKPKSDSKKHRFSIGIGALKNTMRDNKIAEDIEKNKDHNNDYLAKIKGRSSIFQRISFKTEKIVEVSESINEKNVENFIESEASEIEDNENVVEILETEEFNQN